MSVLNPRAVRSAAVVLALLVACTGTSYAAVMIGTNQIKDGAVTSPKVRNNTLTGADVNERTLRGVPSAGALAGGITVKRVQLQRQPTSTGGPKAVVYSSRDLKITFGCRLVASVSTLVLTATTSKGGAMISSVVSTDAAPGNPLQDDVENGTFAPGLTFDLLVGDDGDVAQVEFTYSRAGTGRVVQGTLLGDILNGDDLSCRLAGFVTASGS